MVDLMNIEFTTGELTAKIEFTPESGASGTLRLSSSNLLTVIQQLGEVHKKMTEGLPQPKIEGQRVNPIVDTQWYAQASPIGSGSMLSFYHPSFGLVSFAIPLDQMPKLITLLTGQMQMAEATTTTKQ